MERRKKQLFKGVARQKKQLHKFVAKQKKEIGKLASKEATLKKKAEFKAFAKERRHAAALRTRGEARQQRKRERLQNNRAVGGISDAARSEIGDGSVSLAEAIIISRLEKKGRLHGMTHNQIKDMALRMIGARGRSVGFLAAGWLPSIATMAKKVGQPFRAGAGLKAFNKNRMGKLGYAIPATDWSFKPRVVIANHANSKNDHKAALIKYGQPALQQAFNDEVASMKEYIAKKLKTQAEKLGIRTR